MSNNNNATMLTAEDARQEFMSATVAFVRGSGGESERQRFLSSLQIIQNHQDILAACLNQNIVIEALTVTAFKDDVDLLQVFYDIGMNVNAKDRMGTSPLRSASCYGHETSVRWLLDHGANVDIQDKFGMTPLMHASAGGRTTVLELLLQRNANIDMQRNDGRTALMFASQYGFKEIIEVLLSFNANLDLKDNKEKTALDWAKNEKIKEMLQNHVHTNYVLK